MKSQRFVLAFSTLAVLLLSGCATKMQYYSAGPLGYDFQSLGISAPKDNKMTVDKWFGYSQSTPSGVFAPEDTSQNKQGFAGVSVSLPEHETGYFYNLALSAAGYLGTVSLNKGLEQVYPQGVSKSYQGMTIQFQPSINFRVPTTDLLLGFGNQFWASFEQGDYSAFRQAAQANPLLSVHDASPTPQTFGAGIWAELSTHPTEYMGLGARQSYALTSFDIGPENSIALYYLTPVLGEVVKRTLVSRTEVWVEALFLRLTGGYTTFGQLNRGFHFSIALKL